MQFTKVIVVLSALAGFSTAAPLAAEQSSSSSLLEERDPFSLFGIGSGSGSAAGTAAVTAANKILLNFASSNGTVYKMSAPGSLIPVSTGKTALVSKVVIDAVSPLCIFVTGAGKVFNAKNVTSIDIKPAASILTAACISLKV